MSLRTRLTVLVVGGAVVPLALTAASLLAVLGELAAGTLAVLAAAAALATAVATIVVRWAVERYVHELGRSRTELRTAIDRVGDVLGSTHDRQTIVSILLETAALTAGARVAAFWEWHGGGLEVATVHGDAPPPVLGTTVRRGQGVAGSAADDRVVLSGDAGVDRILPAEGEPPDSAALAVPLHTGTRLFGVLALYGRNRPGPFSADDCDTVASLARQAEAAILNTFLHEEASRLSITDGLTGVWNRRQFDLSAAQEADRAARFGEPFAVVMLDLDRFKDVNDTFGHQAGDAVLIELARRLVHATREVDVVARYGGEEFVLLLPKTGVAGAQLLAEKVREVLATEPVHIDGTAVAITVSAGVAAYPDHGRTAREIVGAADRALYQAKAGGRDRVEVAEPPDPVGGAHPPDPPPPSGEEHPGPDRRQEETPR